MLLGRLQLQEMVRAEASSRLVVPLMLHIQRIIDHPAEGTRMQYTLPRVSDPKQERGTRQKTGVRGLQLGLR